MVGNGNRDLVTAERNNHRIKALGMHELTLAIPDDAVAALAESPEEAGAELRMLAAVKLFELKKLSSGAAARLAGVSRVEFLSRLCAYGVLTFQQSEEELLDEIRNA